MSDFATIEFDAASGVPPDLAVQWQTKHLPEDAELGCCIRARIASDGRLIREDARGKFWNPSLNGLLRLVSPNARRELFCRVDNGVVTLIRDIEESGDWLINEAACDDDMWQAVGQIAIAEAGLRNVLRLRG